MILPGALDLVADRYTPFVTPIIISGVDLTDATFAAQIRAGKNGGNLEVDLATVGSVSSEGIKHVSTTTVGSVTSNVISMRINEATMEGLPLGADPEADVSFDWDMHITPSGGIKQVYLRGQFTVRAGSTQ